MQDKVKRWIETRLQIAVVVNLVRRDSMVVIQLEEGSRNEEPALFRRHYKRLGINRRWPEVRGK